MYDSIAGMSGARLALSEVEGSISDMVSPRNSIDRNKKDGKSVSHRERRESEI
jgi:hypothetical protein